MKCIREERFQIGRGRPLPFDDHKGIVYYTLVNNGTHYDYTQSLDILRDAFNEWNTHFAPLQFVHTSDTDKAYIKIFFSGIKKSWQWLINLFPSMSKYMYFRIEPIPLEYDPVNQNITYGYGFEAFHTNWAGHVYINDLVPWLDMHDHDTKGIVKVITHELGHVANLSHTQDYNANEIMLPEYNIKNIITKDTIDGINHLYADLKLKYNQNVA